MSKGRYGIHGGQYISETLMNEIIKLEEAYEFYKNDKEFIPKLKSCKGFCLSHFGDLCEAASSFLSEKEQKEFYSIVFELMQKNMERLQEDVNWMVEMFDYRNKDADWKTSKDAIQRGMQKLKGGIYG